MKRTVTVILCTALIFAFCCCGKKTVGWNGKTECMAELFMITDFTNPYEYVGMVDYVFVGTVADTERLVLPERRKEHQDHYSTYKIHVDENIKGELAEDIVCSKLGGLKKDGTMLLIAAETPDGRMIMDNGLPEIGKQYVFMAYGQPDGRLTLSEIFDNREYDQNLLDEYTEYVKNEIPQDRERFPSDYQKTK